MLLNLKDIILGPLFLIAILLFGLIMWKVWYNKIISLYIYASALFIKLCSSVAYAFIYQFYYTTGGDTGQYFNAAKFLSNFIAEKPLHQIPQYLFKANLENQPSLKLSHIPNYHLFDISTSYLMIKLTAFVNLLTFNTYLPTAMLMAFFCFSGLTALYKQVVQHYKTNSWFLVIGFFFIPTVTFWAAGVMKDTVTLGALCWLTVALFKMVRLQKVGLWLLVATVMAFIIIVLKNYIFLAFIPAAAFYIVIYWHKSLPTLPVKLFYTFILCSIVISISYYIYAFKLKWLNDVLISNLISQAEGFQSWHGYVAENEGASGYTLGDVEFSVAGILKKLPASINVALFRPYFWEATNPLMLLNALEGFLTLLFTAFVFIKVGVVRFFKRCFSDPMVIFFISYALVFLFAVGFTSYNFGALVRYKIPGFLFYYVALSLLLIKPVIFDKVKL